MILHASVESSKMMNIGCAGKRLPAAGEMP